MSSAYSCVKSTTPVPVPVYGMVVGHCFCQSRQSCCPYSLTLLTIHMTLASKKVGLSGDQLFPGLGSLRATPLSAFRPSPRQAQICPGQMSPAQEPLATHASLANYRNISCASRHYHNHT